VPVNWSDLKVLVAMLGLLDEIEECIEREGCDVRSLVERLKDGIIYRLGAAGREAVEGLV